MESLLAPPPSIELMEEPEREGKRNGRDVIWKRELEMTPLMRAAAAGDVEQVERYLEEYWEYTKSSTGTLETPETDYLLLRDRSGCTALDWARRRKHGEVITLLEDAVGKRLKLQSEYSSTGTSSEALEANLSLNRRLQEKMIDVMEGEDAQTVVQALNLFLEELSPLLSGQVARAKRPGVELRALSRVDFERAILLERRNARDMEEAARDGGSKERKRARETKSTKLLEVEATAGSGASVTMTVGSPTELLAERARAHRDAMAWRSQHALSRQLPPELRGPIESKTRGDRAFWADIQVGSGMNALARAAASRNLELVDRLLRLGADPNVELSNGRTPFEFACASRDAAIVSAMVLFGGNVFRVSEKTGDTPIHSAAAVDAVPVLRILCQCVYEETSRKLLGENAHVSFFQTPKHWAQEFRQVFAIRNREGLTAMDVAEKEGSEEALEFLRHEVDRAEEKLEAWEARKQSRRWTSCPACAERVRFEDMERHAIYLCPLRPPELRDTFPAEPRDLNEPTGAHALAIADRARRLAMAIRARVYHASVQPPDFAPVETLEEGVEGVQTPFERKLARSLLLPDSKLWVRLSYWDAMEAAYGVKSQKDESDKMEKEALRAKLVAMYDPLRELDQLSTTGRDAASRAPTAIPEKREKPPEAVVSCPLGCGAAIPRTYVAIHIGERCPKRRVPCPNGCGDTCEVSELHLHEAECPRGEVICSCGARLPRNLLVKHQKLGCGDAPIRCVLGCGENIRREDMGEHVRFFCSKRVVRCPLCTDEVLFDGVDRHIRDECPLGTMECDRCGTNVTRDYWDEHRRKCHVRPIICPACGSVMALEDLDEHLSAACEATMQLCPLGCGKSFSRKPAPSTSTAPQDPLLETSLVTIGNRTKGSKWKTSDSMAIEESILERHMRQECEKRTVECKRCGDGVILSEMDNHLSNVCPKRPLLCPFGCGEETTLADVESHKLLCRFQPMPCAVESLRCVRQLRSWIVGDWRSGKGRLLCCKSHGSHPLVWAVAKRDIRRVQLILSFLRTHQVDLETQQGQTALTTAAALGYEEIVGLLLDAGADINHCTARGITPLIAAATADHADLVDSLIGQGAILDQRTNLGTTALQRSIAVGAHRAAERMATINETAIHRVDLFRAILRGDINNVGLIVGDPAITRKLRTRRRELLLLKEEEADNFVEGGEKEEEEEGTTKKHIEERDFVEGDEEGTTKTHTKDHDFVEGGEEEDEETTTKKHTKDHDFVAGDKEEETTTTTAKKSEEIASKLVVATKPPVVTYVAGAVEATRRERDELERVVYVSTRSVARILAVVVSSSSMFQFRRAIADRSAVESDRESGVGTAGEKPSLIAMEPSIASVGSLLRFGPEKGAGDGMMEEFVREGQEGDEEESLGKGDGGGGPRPTVRTKTLRIRRLVRRQRRIAGDGMMRTVASTVVLEKELRQAMRRRRGAVRELQETLRRLANMRLLHTKAETGHSPISFAASVGDVAVLELLLRAGAPPEFSEYFLHQVARVIQTAWRQHVRWIRSETDSVEALTSMERREEVMAAVRLRKKLQALAESLTLRQRIRSMHIARQKERLPLHEALFCGRVAAAKLLLRAGARIWTVGYVNPTPPPPFAFQSPLQTTADISKDGTVRVRGLGIKVPDLGPDGATIALEDDVLAHHDESAMDAAAVGEMARARGLDHKRRYAEKKWYVNPNTGVLTLYEKPDEETKILIGDQDAWLVSLPLPIYATEVAALGYERLGHRSFTWGVGWHRSDPHTASIVLALEETRKAALGRFADRDLVRQRRNRARRNRRLAIASRAMEHAVVQMDVPAILQELENDVPPTHEANNGHTPITVAAKTASVVIAPPSTGPRFEGRRLLAAVVILDAFTESPQSVIHYESSLGANALHVAAFHGRLDVIQALVARGADLNSRSAGGTLGVARDRLGKEVGGSHRTRASLAAAAAMEPHPEFRVPWEDMVGMTPLCFAALSGKWRAARLLLELGADPTIPNAAGHTADRIALDREYIRVASVIVGAAREEFSVETGITAENICRYGCGTRIPYGKREQHERTCPKFPLSCPLHCDQEVWRQDLASHIRTSCPNRRLRCPAGCVAVVLGHDLENHLQHQCTAPEAHRESALRTIEGTRLRTSRAATIKE